MGSHSISADGLDPLGKRTITRVAWISDVHLNFVWDREREAFDPEYDAFIDSLRQARADAIVLSGDIAEAPELTWYLERLEADLAETPLYFVLGNHDFYRGSIRAVREQTAELCRDKRSLHYLSADSQPVALSPTLGLLGHDGWADGRFGQLEHSPIRLNDYVYIDELVQAGEEGRRAALNSLGDEAADHVRRLLSEAVQQFPQVLLVTHVPPWLELAQHQGRACDADYAPHFASRAMGEAIVEVMQSAAACQLTVVCGHTHSPAEYRPLPNITALAARAEYGEPALQRVLEF